MYVKEQRDKNSEGPPEENPGARNFPTRHQTSCKMIVNHCAGVRADRPAAQKSPEKEYAGENGMHDRRSWQGWNGQLAVLEQSIIHRKR